MDIQFRDTTALWEGTLEQPAVAFQSVESVLGSIGERFELRGGY